MSQTRHLAAIIAAVVEAKLPRAYWDSRRLLVESSEAYWNGTAPLHFL